MKFLFLIVLSAPLNICAQPESLREKHLNLEETLAIEGYDPVAYFVSNKPVKGKKSLAYTYRGAMYYFASISNRDLFKGKPDKYEPQYGGWCAFAMGDSGEKVEVDPETFRILDGKLYLFYNSLFNNTLNSWLRNEKQLKARADKNWWKICQ